MLHYIPLNHPVFSNFLRILDLSFNRIKKIEGLSSLKKLKKLYLSSNKITKVDGLETLVNLDTLELGDNKIKVILVIKLIDITEKKFDCSTLKIWKH